MISTLFRKASVILAGKEGLTASIQTLLVSVAILGVNILTGIITARVLGPEGRGQQEAIALWPIFLARVFTLGLPSSLIYNLKKTPNQASQLFSATLLTALGAGALAAGIGFVFVPYWLDNYSAGVVRSAQLLMLLAPAVLLDEVYTSALRVQREFRTYNIIRWLRPLSTLALLLIFTLLGRLTPLSAGFSYVVPSLPIAIWLLSYLWKFYAPVWRGLRGAFTRLLSYGIRSYGDLLGNLTMQLEKVFVIGLLSAPSMGLYVVSLSLSRMLNVFQTAVVAVLFPKAAGASTEKAVEMAGRAVRVSTAVTTVSAVGLGVLGPWVLKLLYGAEFQEATNLMRLLIANSVVDGTIWVLAQAFMATGRPGWVTIFQSVGLAFSIPLLFLFVPKFGLLGAGFALLCASIVRFGFVAAAYPLVLKTPTPSILIRVSDIKEISRRLFG